MEIQFYSRSRCGAFPLVAPYVARKVAAPGNGCKWALMAKRGNVSALVFERFCSHNFKTKRAALDMLESYLHITKESNNG